MASKAAKNIAEKWFGRFEERKLCDGGPVVQLGRASNIESDRVGDLARDIDAAIDAAVRAEREKVHGFKIWVDTTPDCSFESSQIALLAQRRILAQLWSWMEFGDTYLDAHVAHAMTRASSKGDTDGE